MKNLAVTHRAGCIFMPTIRLSHAHASMGAMFTFYSCRHSKWQIRPVFTTFHSCLHLVSLKFFEVSFYALFTNFFEWLYFA